MPYAYQAAVTIPAASGSDLTNFTVVISGSDAKLKTVANGGQIQHTVTRVGQTVPADLILSSDSAGTILYNWGVESYDPVNGVVIIWVLIPSYSHTSSTTVYVSIGNAAVSTYQGGAKGAEFDSFTQGVYHLPNGSALNALNFAAAGTAWGDGTAVNTPAAASGVIGGGVSVLNTSGQGQGIALGLSGASAITALTARAWVKTSTAQTMHIFSTWGSSGAVEKFYLAVASGKLQVCCSRGDVLVNGTKTLTDGVWHRVALTWSNGSSITAFTDTDVQTTVAPNIGLNFSGGSPYIGRDLDDSSFWLTGSVDECRVDYVTRSTDWMATELANQSNPPTMAFVPIGGGSVQPIMQVIT